jgi:hypothetical protein
VLLPSCLIDRVSMAFHTLAETAPCLYFSLHLAFAARLASLVRSSGLRLQFRAKLPIFAMSDRSCGVSFLSRAKPPSLPNSTAAGSLPFFFMVSAVCSKRAFRVSDVHPPCV